MLINIEINDKDAQEKIDRINELQREIRKIALELGNSTEYFTVKLKDENRLPQ